MPWVRFEDDYLFNAKIQTLGPYARLLDFSAIIYSARELRDGRLTVEDVRLVARLVQIPRWQLAANELVERGRWQVCSHPSLYVIHDYLEYQPSREKILAKREADRLRKHRTPDGRFAANGVTA
jgi:hypothetical protein